MAGFRFIEGITEADYALEVKGKDIDELFSQSALGVTSVMVDLKTVLPKLKKSVSVKAKSVEPALYDFLEEIIYLKDAEQFLVHDLTVAVKQNGVCTVKAVLHGDMIDMKKQQLRSDVKAVTYHKFKVEKTPKGWKALIVLDV